MVFVTPGDDLAERQRVRYDGVPLLDRPDDVLGRMLGELDGGDEVEVLERAEVWAQIRTPNTLIGWIPTMTLAAVSASAAEDDRETAVVIELPAEADEPMGLEALLEAVAAQRLAHREPEPTAEAALKPARPRVRKPRAGAQPSAEAQTSAAAMPSPTPRRRRATKATRNQET